MKAKAPNKLFFAHLSFKGDTTYFFPFTLLDVSLLLAVLSIVFLFIAEVTPQANLRVKKKNLFGFAACMGALFLVTVVFRLLPYLDLS